MLAHSLEREEYHSLLNTGLQITRERCIVVFFWGGRCLYCLHRSHCLPCLSCVLTFHGFHPVEAATSAHHMCCFI